MEIMRKLCLFTIVLSALLVLQVSGQERMVVNSGSEGIPYLLPAKALVVEVLVERTDYTAGPLQAYASSLLGIDNAIKQTKSVYSIEGVEIKEHSIADMSQRNGLKYIGEKSSKEEHESILTFSPEGILTGINGLNETVSGLQPVAYSTPTWHMEVPDFTFFLAGPNQVILTDTIVQLITVDTATVRDVSYKHTTVERSAMDKAREVVDKIIRLRSDRLALLTGYQEVGYPAGTIEYMNDELKEMEEAYLSLFRGSVYTDQQRYTFIVIPEKANYSTPIVLCGFTEDEGVSTSGRVAGKGIELRFTGEEVDEPTKPATAGLVYRIPATCIVEAIFNNKILGGGIVVIPQMGVLATAPAGIKPMFEIDRNTGAATKARIK